MTENPNPMNRPHARPHARPLYPVQEIMYLYSLVKYPTNCSCVENLLLIVEEVAFVELGALFHTTNMYFVYIVYKYIWIIQQQLHMIL
jgi:hypothetical protein